MSECIRVQMSARVYVYIYVYIRTFMHTHAYIYVYMYALFRNVSWIYFSINLNSGSESRVDLSFVLDYAYKSYIYTCIHKQKAKDASPSAAFNPNSGSESGVDLNLGQNNEMPELFYDQLCKYSI